MCVVQPWDIEIPRAFLMSRTLALETCTSCRISWTCVQPLYETVLIESWARCLGRREVWGWFGDIYYADHCL